jgi:hypothetical protein
LEFGNFKISLTKGASLLLRAEKNQVRSIMVALLVNFVGNDTFVWSLDTKDILLGSINVFIFYGWRVY